MHEDHRWGDVNLDVEAGANAGPHVPERETPFRILVLGDFSGRGNREGSGAPAALHARRPIRVDRDDLDDAVAALSPEIVVQRDSGDSIVVAIQSIDDFHADHLFDTLPHFRALRDLRARLANPSSFADAARELIGEPGTRTPGRADASPAAVRPGHVLDAILGEPLDAPAAVGAPRDELQELIRRSIAPYLVPGEDPRRAPLMEKIDALIATEMRWLLHHPSFQAVEAVWRGLAMLTRRLETDERLQIHVLDISAPELVSDVARAGDSALSRAIARSAADEPWAIIAGAFTFGWDDADLVVLEHLASIARSAGAPFVAGAAPRLVGARSFERTSELDDWSRAALPTWDALRRSPNAPFVGLVAPRFLGRAVYGADGEPCESFAFEELDDHPNHRELLWVNGAFACAGLLGESFTTAGWRLRPGMHRELTSLPYCTLGVGDDAYLQPVAELLLTERAADRMMEAGIMPLASVSGQGSALLVRFQSIAQPIAALAGRWAAARDA